MKMYIRCDKCGAQGVKEGNQLSTPDKCSECDAVNSFDVEVGTGDPPRWYAPIGTKKLKL